MAHAQENQEPHKRKRDADDNGSQPAHSDRIPQPPPPQSGNSSIINYHSKSGAGKLKLIQGDADTFSDVIGLISNYEGVLNRHESLAANLGAKLTGPRLLKAMEGAFEGPIITSPPASFASNPVGWLDIVQFAKSNPDKFVLSNSPEGGRSCQFFMNGVQVQILEDDWRLIVSGALERFSMVSAAPLDEDETAEVATLEIVEQRLNVLIKKADEIARKARQLNYHLIGRKAAINARHSPKQSSNAGFQPVNQPQRHAGHSSGYDLHADLLSQFLSTPSQSVTPRVSSNAGFDATTHPTQPASPATVTPQQQGHPVQPCQPSMSQAPPTPHTETSFDPSAAHRPLISAKIDKLAKGDPIYPPCDRCRRLKAPCIKHLTACQGCTKKHAKCGWRTITEEEITWLNREGSSAAEHDGESGSSGPEQPRLAGYDAARDEGRSVVDEPPPGSARSGDGSRSPSRGNPNTFQPLSPVDRGLQPLSTNFVDVDGDNSRKPWMMDAHRGENVGVKREHTLLSHMASAATAAADARDAGIPTPTTTTAGH